MDSRFLETLVAVVETGTIAAAARRLKLTPAAVSQRLQTLERDLACALFQRGAHLLVPTERCLALMDTARQVIALTGRLTAAAQDDSLRGELRVGAISTALTGLLPQAIRALARQAPALRLRLMPGSSAQIYEDLLAGRVDLGILVAPPFAVPKTLTAHPLRQEDLLFVSARPLAPQDIAARIQEEPFIRYDPASWGGGLVADYLATQGLSPQILCDLDALETILLLVREGLGNSLIPAWAGLDLTGCHSLALAGARRQILLMHPSHSAKPAAIAGFRACLQPLASASAAR